jgi:hypothetical protein
MDDASEGAVRRAGGDALGHHAAPSVAPAVDHGGARVRLLPLALEHHGWVLACPFGFVVALGDLPHRLLAQP